MWKEWERGEEGVQRQGEAVVGGVKDGGVKGDDGQRSDTDARRLLVDREDCGCMRGATPDPRRERGDTREERNYGVSGWPFWSLRQNGFYLKLSLNKEKLSPRAETNNKSVLLSITFYQEKISLDLDFTPALSSANWPRAS